jgi:hypothetical protein
MRRISLVGIATVTALALSTAGCEGGLFGQGETTTEETPTESPVAASPDGGEELQAEQPDGQPTGEATDEATAPPPPPDSEVVASLPRDLDLIPSTDPDQRLQALEGERNDPFSLVPTTPSVQITITETPQPAQPAPAAQVPATPGGQTPARSPGQAPTTATTNGTGNGRTPTTQPGGLAPIPNLVPQPSPTVARAPLPPPPPQPVLARAVEVLGVVQVGDTPYAIVNAPNEASSRYVRVGQSLSNGQVIVKRIEMNGPEPAVVFEQFGVEVITAVGEGGAPSDETSPTAALPTTRSSRQPG